MSSDSTHRQSLQRGLEALPRVDLGVGTTTLDEARGLSAALGGPRILVKRDDTAGGPLGGNKTRMLEYVLGKAIDIGADTVVGGSAAQSNYSRQLAASCARLGLDCHLVLRRVRDESLETAQGSLLLDILFGAAIELVGDDRDHQTRRLAELADELTSAGKTVYKAPQASEADKHLHSAAYVGAALEFFDQLGVLETEPSALYLSSLDMTHAGLLLGLRGAGATFPIRAISPYEPTIFPDHTIEEEVATVATAAARVLGSTMTFEPADINTSIDHVGPAYGALTPDATEAMRLFGRTEAIVLDPVYSAKAAAGLIADIRAGMYAPSETVVFWHTGGLPAVFAYADELSAVL
jgi:1-aminocyclopropane-1-carboxylate deaminase/D-cysteine desulfhydrase-like pyridoxal-dependent ACC family enzyme